MQNTPAIIAKLSDGALYHLRRYAQGRYNHTVRESHVAHFVGRAAAQALAGRSTDGLVAVIDSAAAQRGPAAHRFVTEAPGAMVRTFGA